MFRSLQASIRIHIYTRRANNIDSIRHNIVERGCNTVMKFPFAEKVLSKCKFLVFHPNAVSSDGEPIMAEGMLPVELWDVVTVEEYLRFRLYGLELISILLGVLNSTTVAYSTFLFLPIRLQLTRLIPRSYPISTLQ